MITATPRNDVKPNPYTMEDAKAMFAGCRPEVQAALDGIGVSPAEAREIRTRAYLAAFFARTGEATRAWAEAMVRETEAVLAAQADMDDLSVFAADEWPRTPGRSIPPLRSVDPDTIEDAELADLHTSRPA